MIDLSTIQVRKILAQKWAAKYLLDSALVAAVAEHESSWCPWAVRFEPRFLRHYVQPAIPEAPTTSDITKSCSFGLMQIMGLTAIEFGFTGRFLTELCDPDTGMDFGCRKLRKCLDERVNDVNGALLAYNGGGDSNYPQAVRQLMAAYY